MRNLLEFDDAGATNNEPAKGVTVGDIRAWHDNYSDLEHDAHRDYQSLEAECGKLASLLREARQYVSDAGSDEDGETQRNSTSLLRSIDEALSLTSR